MKKMKKILTLTLFIAVMALASTAAYIYFSTKNAIDSMLESAQPFVSIQYQKFSNPMNGSISIHGVTISPILGMTETTIDIGSIELRLDSALDYLNFEKKIESGEILPKLQLKVNHVYADLNLIVNDDPDDAELISAYITALSCGEIKEIGSKELPELDYIGIDTSVNLNFEYDKYLSNVEMEFEITLHDMARYSAKLLIPNINSPADLANINTKISSLEFELQDLGYNSRVIEYCVKQNGLKPDVYVDKHIQALKGYVSDANIHLSENIYDAYRAYFVDQASLTIVSQPLNAINLQGIELYETKEWANILGLTLFVDANPPSLLRFDWNKDTAIEDLLNARSIAIKEAPVAKPRTRTNKRENIKSIPKNREISISDIYDYVNYPVRLETKQGKTFKGFIIDVVRGRVIIEIRLKGGKAEMPIDITNIEKVFIAKP
ncbi:MAG: hypothetical protein GQ547_01020 [Methylophaga sp.]|nr:hypothetical protein [Methylophaga sp.]